MIQSLYNGASGLRAQQTQMDVIGNNIANINTTGYKSSRVDFQEALTQTLQDGTAPGEGTGGKNPIQKGMGVQVGSVTTNFDQGSLQNTGRSLDVAINGKGFLALSDGTSQFFTRDGSLSVDSNSGLVSSANGLKVLGWNMDPATGTVDTAGALGAIKLPSGQTSLARQTGNVSYNGNLNADLAAGKSATATFDVYDSLGKSHSVKMTFTKSATAGEWNWSALPAGAADDATPMTGTLAFDANGKVASGANAEATLPLPEINGATGSLKLKLDFSAITSLTSTSASTVAATSQDGLPPGTLTGYSIGEDGTITGNFSNGMNQALARIAIADFSNPGGLNNVNGNMFATGPNSGLPQVGTAGTNGRGKLTSGALEMSNVDLSREFTNMIVTQRGFQANSKIITTSDELLQDVLNLKR